MRSMGLFKGIGIILILVLLPFLAWSQEVYSLDRLVAAGLQRNYDIRITSWDVKIAENNNTWGAAGRYPTINLGISQNNRVSDIDNPASFLNGQIVNQSLTGSADLNWVLFNGFRVNINKSRLGDLERLAGGNLALVVENTLQAIILGYYQVLLETRRLEVLQENLLLTRDRYSYVAEKKALGVSTTFDLLQERQNLMTDSINVVRQQLNVRNAIRNIQLLLGLSPENLIIIDGELSFDPEIYSYEALEQKMLANNQTLQNQFINLSLSRRDLELQSADMYPSLSLNLGSNYTKSRVKFEDRDASTGRTFEYYANFSLNFTLFNGGNIRREIESAEMAVQSGQIAIEQIKHQLNHELANAWDLYETRLEILQYQQQLLEIASQNVDIAGEKFKAGVINSFNYRDIQLAYLNAAFSLIEAYYNLKEAEIALTRLTGGFVEEI